MSQALSHRPTDNRLKGIVLRIVATLSFATMAAIGKRASQHGIGAIELVFFRSLFALPVVLLWVGLGPGLRAIGTRRPRAHLLRATLGLAGMVLLFQALVMLPLAEAITISFASPLFATLLAALLLSERVARYRWAAVLTGFAGILIVTQPGGHEIPLLGALAGLCGALAAAAVNITLRHIGATESAAATVFWFMMMGTVATGTLLLFQGTTALTPMLLLELAAVGLAGGVAQISLTKSLQLAPVSALAPFDYLQLLGAIFYGWLFWSDVPAWTTVAGGALVVGSGIYTLYREQNLHVARLPLPPGG
jgi:drug/metabolite transporter (DMT)-like permease